MIDEPKRPLTAAEKACYHIFRRVQSCPDFAWLMVGTESLDLVCAAVAEHRGMQHAQLKRSLEERAASRTGTPEVRELREKVEELQGELDAMEFGPKSNNARKADAWCDQIAAMEEVLRLADLGLDVLRVDVLREALAGRRMAAYKLPPARMGVG